jgi:AraC-like DNA-binding protein
VRLVLQTLQTRSVGAELIRAPAGVTLVGHAHAERHVLLVLDGAMSDDGRPYRNGEARASAPGDTHFVRFLRPSLCLVVTSHDDPRLPDVPDRWSGPLGITLAPAIGKAVRAATTAATSLTTTEFGQLVDNLLNAFERSHEAIRAAAAPPWLSELRLRVLRAEGISHGSARWAKAAGISREHLARTFRRCFGTSFTTFRWHQRVALARRLMASSDWPLCDVALAAGFADQSHMTRAFRRCLDSTPASVAPSLPRTAMSQTFKPQDGRAR